MTKMILRYHMIICKMITSDTTSDLYSKRKNKLDEMPSR